MNFIRILNRNEIVAIDGKIMRAILLSSQSITVHISDQSVFESYFIAIDMKTHSYTVYVYFGKFVYLIERNFRDLVETISIQ